MASQNMNMNMNMGLGLGLGLGSPAEQPMGHDFDLFNWA
jgi:hypothetical protein